MTGPQNELKQANEQQMAADRKTRRAFAGLPDEIVEAFSQRSGRIHEVLRRELPETNDQVLALLRIYGTDNNSWTQLDGI